MAQYPIGTEVILRRGSKVLRNESNHALVRCGDRNELIGYPSLDRAPAPVTVTCSMDCEHPLTALKTLRDRFAALGMLNWGGANLEAFVHICAALAEKGVTAEQVVEGLT